MEIMQIIVAKIRQEYLDLYQNNDRLKKLIFLQQAIVLKIRKQNKNLNKEIYQKKLNKQKINLVSQIIMREIRIQQYRNQINLFVNDFKLNTFNFYYITLKNLNSQMQITKQQYYEDLNYILSCIRVRENNLIFLLDKYKNQQFQYNYPSGIHQLQHHFLLEENLNTQNIHSYIIKYTHCNHKQQLIELTNQFWIRLKKLIKVSLERIKLLNLLSLGLSKIYQEFLKIVNNFIAQNSELKQLIQIEIILKKKYNHIIFGKYKQQVYSEVLQKNDYKGSIDIQQHKMKVLLSNEKRSQSKKRKKSPIDNIDKNDIKMVKCINKQQIKDDISPIKKFIQKDNKKLIKFNQKLQSKVYDILNTKIDLTNFDKKMNRQHNAVAIYDQLFEKNIPNHKVIIKYIFEINQKVQKSDKKILRKFNFYNKIKKLKKQQLNKSSGKLKNIKKKQQMQSNIFGYKQLKKLQEKIIKLRPRPKTAKFQNLDLEINTIFQISKNHYRKLLRKNK